MLEFGSFKEASGKAFQHLTMICVSWEDRGSMDVGKESMNWSVLGWLAPSLWLAKSLWGTPRKGSAWSCPPWGFPASAQAEEGSVKPWGTLAASSPAGGSSSGARGLCQPSSTVSWLDSSRGDEAPLRAAGAGREVRAVCALGGLPPMVSALLPGSAPTTASSLSLLGVYSDSEDSAGD